MNDDPTIQDIAHYDDAEWDVYRKAAGPLRNAEMLKTASPDLVITFSDDHGAIRCR